MKHKLTAILFATLICALCVFGFTACKKCEHEYGEWTVVTAATCTQNGEQSHTCTKCGKTQKESIDALGHDMQGVSAKAPTCTEAGWDAYEQCSRCDHNTKQEEITALGHEFGESWTNDESGHWHACTRGACEVKSNEAAHSEVNHYCLVCGLKTSEHVYGEVTYDWSGDHSVCTATRFCLNCSADIEGHWQSAISVEFSERITQKADCVKPELSEFTATFVEKWANEAIAKDIQTSDARGHDFSDSWTYDEKGHWHACNRKGCEAKRDETEHVYDESKTTYTWSMNPEKQSPVACVPTIACKHCAHTTEPLSEGLAAGFVVRKGFIYTSHLKDTPILTACSDQTFDISDATEMSREDVKKAVQIMVGDGTSDSVDVKVTLKNENSDYLSEVYAALEKAKDGSVNLTINGIKEAVAGSVCSGKIKSLTLGDVTTISKAGAFTNSSNLTEITFNKPITECVADAFDIATQKVTLRLAVGQKVLTLDEATNTYKETDEIFESGSTFFGKNFNKIISQHHFNIDATEMSADEFGTKLDEARSLNVANVNVTFGANADGDMFAVLNAKTDDAINLALALTGVTAIPENAFDNKALRAITLPKTVTSIASGAFYGCDNLKKVYYEGELADWLKIEFSDVYSSPCINGAELYFNGTLAESITISGVTSIGFHFTGCASIKSVVVGDDVTSIGAYEFHKCTSLNSVTLSKNVSEIGEGAFGFCSSLESVTGGEKISKIGQTAFYRCISLASINIPDGATIGQEAFFGCTLLKIPVVAELTDSNNADEFFAALKAKIKYYGGGVKLILKGVTEIPENAFSNNNEITAIVLPKTLTSVGNNAFYCENLKEVYYEGELADWLKIEFGNLSSSPCAFGAKLYFNGTLAENITISGVNKIGFHFTGCTSIKSVVIGDEVTSIEDYAFMGCTALESVTIGKNVKSIGMMSFYCCSALKSITFNGTKEEWNAITKGDYWNGLIVATGVVCSGGERVTL